ncbi:hypothetical protein EST38_g11361 [Candolleomyces aberdarensis]|uniref:Uncharacterized protein n=1 Tax=Candolleomyces aberdarensis TaxID=2316362 RepID=A0A4Q2D518_9AGAR|nr:hypothetical protein EST38_g11361 [Candolleomyces aberdarensis]
MPNETSLMLYVQAAEAGTLAAYHRLYDNDWANAEEQLTRAAYSMLFRRLSTILSLDPTLFRFAQEVSVTIALATKIMTSARTSFWADTLFRTPSPYLKTLYSAVKNPKEMLVGFKFPQTFVCCLASDVVSWFLHADRKDTIGPALSRLLSRLVMGIWFWGRPTTNAIHSQSASERELGSELAVETVASALLNDDIRAEVVKLCEARGRRYCRLFADLLSERSTILTRPSRKKAPRTTASIPNEEGPSDRALNLFAAMESSKEWFNPAATKPTVLECFASGIDLLPREERVVVLRRLLSQGLLLPTVREIILTTSLDSDDWFIQKSWGLFHLLCEMSLDRQFIHAVTGGLDKLDLDTTHLTIVPLSEELWNAFKDNAEKIAFLGHQDRYFYLSVLQSYMNSARLQELAKASLDKRNSSENLKLSCPIIFPVLIVDPVPTKCVFYSLNHLLIDLDACCAPKVFTDIVNTVKENASMQLGIITFIPPCGLRQFVVGSYRNASIGVGRGYELVAGAAMSRLEMPINLNTASENDRWEGYIPSTRHPDLNDICRTM